jgi:caa(3)-type oxidase subunit IV
MSEHAHPNYVKVWMVLLALLVISVLGPMVGIKVVTLMTAFGIAVVKAYLVAKNFMHVNVEPRYVAFLLATMLVFMFLLFAGASPDVMKSEGSNWLKPPAEMAEVQPAHH